MTKPHESLADLLGAGEEIPSPPEPTIFVEPETRRVSPLVRLLMASIPVMLLSAYLAASLELPFGTISHPAAWIFYISGLTVVSVSLLLFLKE
jgi:hypothetical protein